MRSLILTTFATLTLVIAPLTAQTPAASVTYIGGGCGPSGSGVSAPTLSVQGFPQLGGVVTIRYRGMNIPGWYDQHPFLITGTGSASLPIPQLTSLMSRNCTLVVDPILAVFALPRWVDFYAYNVPSTPTLIGASVYHQWGSLVTDNFGTGSTTVHWASFSNGVHLQVGF